MERLTKHILLVQQQLSFWVHDNSQTGPILQAVGFKKVWLETLCAKAQSAEANVARNHARQLLSQVKVANDDAHKVILEVPNPAAHESQILKYMHKNGPKLSTRTSSGSAAPPEPAPEAEPTKRRRRT